MGMTYVQKLLARACERAAVETGEVLELPVHLAMSHENAALVINQFNEIFRDTGRESRVWDPDRIAIIFDHRVPAESSKTATNQKKIRDFVAEQGISKFHDIRGDVGGICHQILPKTVTCGPARCWWAPTATRPRTVRSVPLHSASAPRRWPRSGPWGVFSTLKCRAPSR